MTPALIELYRRYAHAPLEWGVHDCVLWTARCLDAQFETHYEAWVLREYEYKTGMSAYRHVRRGGGLESMVSKVLGPSVPLAFVYSCDVVLIPLRDPVTSLGIAVPNGVLTPGPRGVICVPYIKDMRGWTSCRKR